MVREVRELDMIDDESIRNILDLAGTRPNPARAARGISTEQARRGTPEFDDLMDDLEDEWELDEEELDDIVEIRRAGEEFEVRYKGETRWVLIEEEGDDEDQISGPDEDFGGGAEE